MEITGDMSPQLADLIQRLLCKGSFPKKKIDHPMVFIYWKVFFILIDFFCVSADPAERITLQAAAEHPWVAGADGPVPEFICRCGFGRRKRNAEVQ